MICQPRYQQVHAKFEDEAEVQLWQAETSGRHSCSVMGLGNAIW